MKIYCNTSKYNITDFIGKDVWVKCDVTSIWLPLTYPIYILPMSVQYLSNGDSQLRGYCINPPSDSIPNISEDELVHDFIKDSVWPLENINVITPLELFTDDDIRSCFGL